MTRWHNMSRNQPAWLVGLGCASVLAAALWSCKAFAQTCVIQGPRYALASDTVDWSIQVASGQSCVRGLRLGDVLVETLSLTTPPKSRPALFGSRTADYRAAKP
jgi:hypothetical protein